MSPENAIAQRLPEIERDLQQHYSSVEIKVLNTFQHRGNIELYFKHRYREFNYPIGKLTEYYRFDDVAPVMEDLFSVNKKVLNEEELEILEKMERSSCRSRQANLLK